MTSSCEADVRPLSTGAVIELTGDVDGAAADTLAAAYERAAGYDSGAGADPATIVMDFSDVGYINSTGIAVIVSVLARARAQRRAIVACGLSDHYREIFDITRLSDFIELFSDLDEAMSHLGQPSG